jgi:hypothetical protein
MGGTDVRHFVDCVFHEDGKTIDLISIALVAEDGREYYACSLEAELNRVSPWLREHVLPKLPPYSDSAWRTRRQIAEDIVIFTGGLSTPMSMYEPSMYLFTVGDIVGERPAWYPTKDDDTKISFVGYYADYDWVVLCQLYGTMMALPKQFPKYCMDLKQLSVDVGSPQHPPGPANEHCALDDARWNRDLYAFLMKHKAAVQAHAIDMAVERVKRS